jgi:hypothetical protein
MCAILRKALQVFRRYPHKAQQPAVVDVGLVRFTSRRR